MQPIADMPREVAANIQVVFADIDDTLTTDGRLTAGAYAALEDLKAVGLKVALVTGRPAGWCDMIARFWPVDGVVGENGAFYYTYDQESRKMQRVYHPAVEEHLRDPERFARIRQRIEAEVPGAAISADQPFRIADLAVDFCEDVPPLPVHEVELIKAIFEEEGAVAKISSIHVNGWFGHYDKLTMARAFAADRLGLDVEQDNQTFLFVGDSPNDAPMFSYFEHSCGVANVVAFDLAAPQKPKWIASKASGAGFVEIASHILSARG